MIAVADLIEVHGGDVDVDAVERAARCSRCKIKSITSTQIIYVGSSETVLKSAGNLLPDKDRGTYNEVRHSVMLCESQMKVVFSQVLAVAKD
jgi:hypothetical protein